ncbi:S1 family peptidase [Streptomyces sp. NPDC055254]
MKNSIRGITLALVAFLSLALQLQGTPATAIENGRTAIADAPTGAAQIYQRKNGDWLFVCSGSVVGPKIVLTATHCLEQGRDPAKYLVRVGNTTRAEGHLIHVDAMASRYELTLFFLKYDVSQLSGVKHLDISSGAVGDIGLNDTATVYGWGKTGYWADLARVLKNADVRVTDSARDILGGPALRVFTKDGARIFWGDSGGPVVKTLPNGQTVQVGVTSKSEATSGSNSAYATIARFDPGNTNWLYQLGVPVDEEW